MEVCTDKKLANNYLTGNLDCHKIDVRLEMAKAINCQGISRYG